MNAFHQRYHEHQANVQNATAAALLVVAEEIHDLVHLLKNVDDAVTKIESHTIKNVPINVSDFEQGVKYIKDAVVSKDEARRPL